MSHFFKKIISMVSSAFHVFFFKNRDQDILKMSHPTIWPMSSLMGMPASQPLLGSSSLEACYVSDPTPRMCCLLLFVILFIAVTKCIAKELKRWRRDEGWLCSWPWASRNDLCGWGCWKQYKIWRATQYKATCLRIQSETGNYSILFYSRWIFLFLASFPSKHLKKHLSKQNCHRI